MVFSAVANRIGEWIELGPEGFIEKRPTDLETYVDRLIPNGEVSMVSILKKTKDIPFRLPFQGKYQRDIRDSDIASRYAAGKNLKSF